MTAIAAMPSPGVALPAAVSAGAGSVVGLPSIGLPQRSCVRCGAASHASANPLTRLGGPAIPLGAWEARALITGWSRRRTVSSARSVVTCTANGLVGVATDRVFVVLEGHGRGQPYLTVI